MTEEQAEFDTLEDALGEIRRLRASFRLREQENNVPAAGDGNAGHDRRRQSPDSGYALHSLYNDLLLSHTPNMIFLFNEKLEYVIGSSACYRITRASGAELANRPLARVFSPAVDAGWVEKIADIHREVLGSLQAFRFHDTIEMGDGAAVNVHITISPMVDEEGVCRGTIMVVNDVSELFQARRIAEEAAKSKASFLANMSHEIRTPMNAIKGLSELLQLTPLNAMQKNYVKNIVGSANSLMIVINDVLDFSKIDANKLEFVSASYSIHKLLSELCGVVGLRAEQKGLDLFLEISPDVPSRLVGDENRVKQILLNLLSNAIKYTPAGRVMFRMSSRARTDGRVDLLCAVQDTGIGIKPEDATLIFNAFSRVDPRANRAIQGTGLGLAISKRLAEAMGGDITVSSVYGEGSVFTLAIPHGVEEAKAPLASVEGAGEVRVLLLGSSPRMMNAAVMLESLGVGSAFMDESGTDVGMLRKLAQPRTPLPVCGGPGAPYTHCIYPDIVPDRDLAALRERLPGCRFACLRSIFNSLQEPGRRDTMLFTPLLITDLAKFLNKGMLGTSGRLGARDTLVSVRLRVRDATALVVDDNRINLLVCEKMLNLYGMEVKTASGGEEALELCRENTFDILFVDHMMPVMDGIELTAEIRGNPGPNRKTPIVALTANVINDMRSYYITCGMDDVVAKPIDIKEMVRVLQQWLPADKLSREMPAKDIG